MRGYFKMLPTILLGTILFLSIGFSSFSSNLTIGDIRASVRGNKNIRVTAFYATDHENGGNSSWEEYSSNKIITNVILPNSSSTVTYVVEVTNLDNEIMMIDSISGLPDNIEYQIIDYNLKDKICNTDNVCNSGIKKRFEIVLSNKNGHTMENEQVVGIDIVFDVYTYRVIFDANNGSGSMDPINLKYNDSINLPACLFHRNGYSFTGWNTASDGSGTSYTNEQLIQNISNDENEITLYAQWATATNSIYYPGLCEFNGKNNDIEGTCAEGKHIDYINTGIAPFSETNIERNFVLSLKIDSVDDSLFNSNSRGTIFNMIYENNDSIGKYPGVVLRIENGKWLLQGSRGVDPNYANKVYLQKQDLLGKELKVIRYNDGNTIKLYYTIDDDGPYLLKDITEIPNSFDTILTFGAGLDYDNVTVQRHVIADISDISFQFWPDGSTLEEMSGIIINPPDEGEMENVFSQQGVCEFHGASSFITGSSCGLYSSNYMINTGVQLFTSTGLTQDFDLSFKIDSYNIGNQEIDQTTLLNAFRERSDALGYGILIRRNRSNLQFIFRDGNGGKKEFNMSPSTVSSVRIIKKGNYICYSLNDAPFKYAISVENLLEPFNVPVTFGGSIDANGNPFRYITGELSEMKIDVGSLGNNVECDPSMT